MCVRAASLGYVDYCPNLAVPTTERLEMTTGLIQWERPNYFFSRVSKQQDFGYFLIFSIWKTNLWIVVFFWVILCGFLARVVGGYYIPLTAENVSGTLIIREVFDLIWFGWGMFLDLIFPQHPPTRACKMIILCFEFVQVLLLASLTASLTKFLVMEKEVGISNFNEILDIPNAKLCFEQEPPRDVFLTKYPDFPLEKTHFFQTLNEIEQVPECYGIVDSSYNYANARGIGNFCDWEERDFLYSYKLFGATNPKIHDVLSAVYKIYESTLYQQDIANTKKTGIAEDRCNDKVIESNVFSLFFIISFCVLNVTIKHTKVSKYTQTLLSLSLFLSPRPNFNFLSFTKINHPYEVKKF